MSRYALFEDHEVNKRFAQGLIKAGVPGDPRAYCKFNQENRLTGIEIKELIFGQSITGLNPYPKSQWWHDFAENGIVTSRGIVSALNPIHPSDKGRAWIEGDTLCVQWEDYLEGFRDCYPIFSNPEGNPEMKDEYFAVSAFRFHVFSLDNISIK